MYSISNGLCDLMFTSFEGTPSFERQAASSIQLTQNASSGEVQHAVRKALELQGENLVLKVCIIKGTRCLGSVELVSEKRFVTVYYKMHMYG